LIDIIKSLRKFANSIPNTPWLNASFDGFTGGMLNIANEIKGPHRFTGQITQRGAPSLNFEVRGSTFGLLLG
jgi:hypothetical protein